MLSLVLRLPRSSGFEVARESLQPAIARLSHVEVRGNNMVQYTDLPAELRSLFGSSLMPPETRNAVSDYWARATEDEKSRLIDKLQNESDPLKRVVVALAEAAPKLRFADVKRIIGEHLRTALGITDFTITFAKQEGDIWRVNVVLPADTTEGFKFADSALLAIDGRTGEVRQFEKGRTWTL